MMYVKTYKVRYAKTGEIFEKEFMDYGNPLDPVPQQMSRLAALERVNDWNIYNTESGFTYWIE